MTRSDRIFERSAMSSSVRPSAKNALSGSGLRFWNGRTTMEACSTWCGRDMSRPLTSAGAVSSARSANARSAADWKRAAGCFSTHRVTMRARSGGASVAAAVTSGTGADRTAASVSVGVARANARRPVAIS